MINCVIVSEDPVCINLVKHYCNSIAELNLAKVFTGTSEAQCHLSQEGSEIDLIFLDVEISDLASVGWNASFKELPPVILISSKEKCPIEGLEQMAFYNLMKPLEYAKFLRAVEPLFIKLQSNRNNFNCIYAKENGIMTKVNYDDILYFETLGDYVKIHTRDKIHVVNSSMRSIEKKLQDSSQFMRIHRTYYININYLEKFDSEVAVISNRTIPIGSKYRSELQSRLMII